MSASVATRLGRAAPQAKSWLHHVLYHDRKLIALNKPSGLVCQGTVDQLGNTPQGDVIDDNKFNTLLDDVQQQFNLSQRPSSVHRLDKPTTGVLLLAKSPASARDLSTQLAKRTVDKTYLALVRGGAQSFEGSSGEIRNALQADEGRMSVGDSCNARFAATDWELLASSPICPLSLVRLRLHTGVKHQLRVHLANVLHTPILGDRTYSRSVLAPAITKVTPVPQDRVFLHAARIEVSKFRKQGTQKHFRLGVAAPLPHDFVAICQKAKIPLNKLDITGGLFVDGEPAGRTVEDIAGEWLG